MNERSDSGAERYIRLTKSYDYDGDRTTKIPIIHARDHGGAILVHCPDGSSRMFDRGEVRSIDPDTDRPSGDSA